MSPRQINHELINSLSNSNTSCINLRVKCSNSKQKLKLNRNDEDYSNENYNTVIIKDLEESKEYSANEQDLFSSYDPKFGNILLKAGDVFKFSNPTDKNSSFEQSQLPKQSNFRLPSFPFCKTCHKNNSDFLENMNFLMVNETGNGKILIPKSTFIKKLENGGFKINKDLIHPKVVKNAMENYQLKYGAHKLRDIDYDMHKDIRAGHVLQKLKDKINSRTSKSEY